MRNIKIMEVMLLKDTIKNKVKDMEVLKNFQGSNIVYSLLVKDSEIRRMVCKVKLSKNKSKSTKLNSH